MAFQLQRGCKKVASFFLPFTIAAFSFIDLIR